MSYIEKNQSVQNNTLLSVGKWNNSISWEFFASNQEIDAALCTAVCCVVTHNDSLLLVKNKRGWELPAGKIEKGESALDAVVREVLEETAVIIENATQFGYKKLTANEPIRRPDQSQEFFPFPHSYVVFFFAVAIDFIQRVALSEIMDTKLASYSEATQLLAKNNQYQGIIEYLLDKKKIDLH
jgi:8-oxo-dGTP pyrophosphatase MutT (NUDIX family)